MAEITLEEAPRKAKENFEKGLAALERNNPDYAMDMFEVALELAPNLLRARKFLRAAAIRKLKGGKSSGLTHAMSSLTGMGSFLAAQSKIKKQPGEAVKIAEKLLRKDPLNMQFINLMVQAATAAGMPEVAVLTLEIAKDHYPNDTELLRNLARRYQDADRMHDSRVIYEEVLRLKPNDQKALKELKDSTALDTMQRGGWTDTESSFRDKMSNKQESLRLEQASKAVKTGRDIDDLVKETLEKIEREPQNVNYKRSLADLYAKSDRYDEALAVLQEAQKQTGGSDPQIDRMATAVRIKQIDAQIAALESAGDGAGAEGVKKQKAQFLFDDAHDKVRRYPNDLQFKYDLGVIHYERGEWNEALQILQLAQRNPQRRIRALYYLALCFKQKQQYDIALEQLEKANAELNIMDDTKKDVLYELGITCEAMGKMEKAVEYFKEIYSVDIGYRDVTQRIEKFYKK